jgi:hypothetical protein
MDRGVAPVDRPRDGLAVEHVAGDDLDLFEADLSAREDAFRLGGIAYEKAHAVAPSQQRRHRPRAHEPGPAGEQHTHVATVSPPA